MDKINSESPGTRRLSSQSLPDFFQRHEKDFDQDKDGFISRQELAHQLESGSLKGADARIAETVLENFHALELLSNDEWGTENNGISRSDRNAFEKIRGQKPNTPLVLRIDKSLNADAHDREKFVNLVKIYKNKIDDDKSGTISKPELSYYVQSSQDGSSPVETARFLLEHFDYINQIGSKNSSGDYSHILAGDANPRAIGANELSTLFDVLGPEEQFIDKVMAVHNRKVSKGTELGKQGRLITGRGDSGVAALIGTALEIAGSATAHDSQHTLLLTDHQKRKYMIDSWKFFK